ncbi:hypothetical protein [Halomonas ramblicola]|uniref:hypothetical protein n=1 Tax=Halomonas ramblicola TaxID=747349 RepID=UPI0025B3EAA2|nr:hypothetical protein [Halomonas ramblicola]MDN3520710.1 hypothetical protein [Halomonas ramblicola]
MTPEEIKQIVETAVEEGLGFIWWHYLLAAIAVCISFLFGAYLKRKGQDLATRENIEELTSLVESVKKDVRNNESIAQAKRQMKHDACLEALSVIDAFFSHFFTSPKPTPQVADSAKAREVHSKLILACDNSRIIELYTEILCGPVDGERVPPTDQLNELRNLIRKELGFGSEVNLDRERAWFGQITGDPNNPKNGNAGT